MLLSKEGTGVIVESTYEHYKNYRHRISPKCGQTGIQADRMLWIVFMMSFSVTTDVPDTKRSPD